MIRTPKVGELSRKERDEHKALLSEKQAKVIKYFDDFKRLEKSWPEAIAKIRELSGAEEGDLLVLVAAPKKAEAAEASSDDAAAERRHQRDCYAVYSNAGQLRLALAQRYAERHKAFEGKTYKFLWVTDFPSFEWDAESETWTFAHHPFTSLHEDHMELLDEGVKALHDPNSAARRNSRPRLRRGAERNRTRLRLDSYPPAGSTGEDL